MKQGRFGTHFVPAVSKALDVLEAFRSPGEELSLEELIQRTRIAHGTAYRILFTLVHRGYVSQSAATKKYRLMPPRRKRKIGYCSLGEQPFAAEVTRSVERAAQSVGFSLVALDNQWDAQTAIHNARLLAKERVDIAINFQAHANVAPVIADIFAQESIPTIAVELPQPGATYYGVDNYRAGWAAGEVLARHALVSWGGDIDLFILLDMPAAGQLSQTRLTGVTNAISSILGKIRPSKIHRVDGKSIRQPSAAVTAEILKKHPRARRILLTAANDISAMGGLDALREMHRVPGAAVVSFGGMREALVEIANRQSPYIATIGFHPERYGDGLIDLVVRLLAGEPVPPFNYVEHEVIDRSVVWKIPGFTAETA